MTVSISTPAASAASVSVKRRSGFHSSVTYFSAQTFGPGPDAHAVADGDFVQPPPSPIRELHAVRDGTFQLQTAASPDANGFAILKFRPIVHRPQ